MHPITIAQNSLFCDAGASGAWHRVPPKAATIGPKDLVNSKLNTCYHWFAYGDVSWQRFITRLILHGPVTPKVPGSIYQVIGADVWLSGRWLPTSAPRRWPNGAWPSPTFGTRNVDTRCPVAAPDFYFAINATFRHLHDVYGKAALIDYWRSLGREYYQSRTERWKNGDLQTVAADWHDYFAEEPRAVVDVTVVEQRELTSRSARPLNTFATTIATSWRISASTAITFAPAMAETAGYAFHREGGKGKCRQRFVQQPPDTKGGPRMLGCQDFCGHYEWTFHYVRRRWGQDAVRRFWAEAIGGESQQHYTQSAARVVCRVFAKHASRRAWTKAVTGR